jgi:hypothetical protein
MWMNLLGKKFYWWLVVGGWLRALIIVSEIFHRQPK